MYIALGIAAVVYVAISLGVYGTLTVDEVIASGGTAIAVAAEPVLGRAGYWLMSVTALFATAGATNAGLYPAAGLCEQMATTRQFPPTLGRRYAGQARAGLLLTAAIAIVLAVGFDLSAIASIGSAIALLVFALIAAGHMRVRHETGARPSLLIATGRERGRRPRSIHAHDPGQRAGNGSRDRRRRAPQRRTLDLGWKHARDDRHPHTDTT